MRVYQYDPWSLMDHVRHEFNRRALARNGDSADSNVITSDWQPAVDIRETDDGYVLLVDVPGVDPDGIEVNMENGILSVRGERADDGDHDREYKRRERPHGTFYRRFSMPDTADASKITARCNHGVVEISIPKHEKLQPRRIAIEQ